MGKTGIGRLDEVSSVIEKVNDKGLNQSSFQGYGQGKDKRLSR